MPTVVLFHHAQGLTPGIEHLADRFRAGGHEVIAPDLFEGRTFATLDEGVDYAQGVGFDVIAQRGRDAVEHLSPSLVYAGISLGVVPAQMLTQTREGALGGIFISACLPFEEFGTWPTDMPVQIHAMTHDAQFKGEGDYKAASQLVDTTDFAELYLYPGRDHLFADDSLDTFDENITTIMSAKCLEFLDAKG